MDSKKVPLILGSLHVLREFTAGPVPTAWDGDRPGSARIEGEEGCCQRLHHEVSEAHFTFCVYRL